MTVAASVVFIVLLAIQEVARADGTSRAIAIVDRLNPLVVATGTAFAVLMVWRLIVLAT